MSSANKTVLTVDDDASVRLLIKSALQHIASINIIEAVDGVDGLESIRARRPDLVILDVVMPRMDGIQTLKTLRGEPPLQNLPVILLTGYKDNERLQPLLENAHTDFLSKPFLIELLRHKVLEILYPNGVAPAVS